METLTIVKIGGNITDNEDLLRESLAGFAALPGKKMLVHGGGKLATQLAGKLGVRTVMVEGRRITDQQTLDIVTMVYGGLINKKITAQLNAAGLPAIGLTGADLFLIPSAKRTIGNIDFGFVGDIDKSNVNSKFFRSLLEQDITPVIAPLTADKGGQLLNTNADTIAATLAAAMSSHYYVKLIFCFTEKGVMNKQQVIPEIKRSSFADLRQSGIVSEGMIPKLDNAITALEDGVQEVYIGHALQLQEIITHHAGTRIKNEEIYN